MTDVREPTARALDGPRRLSVPGPPGPAVDVGGRAAGPRGVLLAGRVRPDGRPHATPLWGAWVDQRLYLDGPPTTVWARNFSANPAVTVHLESGAEVVVLEGIADDVTTDADLGARIVASWMRKYGRLAPDPAGDGIWRVTLRSVRAWSTEMLDDGTGWTFS